MGDPDPNKVIGAGGRLSFGPTTLAIATGFPWGGTGLGVTSVAFLMPNFLTEKLLSPERNETHEELYLGEDWDFVAVLREFDPDVLSAIFPNTSAGASPPDVTVRTRGAVRPGSKISDRSKLLLWTPQDVTQPFVAIPRALPTLKDTAEIGLAFQDEVSFATSWSCIEGAAGLDPVIWGSRVDVAALLGIAS